MSIITERHDYAADGLALRGTLYRDAAATGAGPGILVFPEALGPGPNAHDRARRLAALGYTALVCDLHGEARVYHRLEEVMALIQPLRENPERLRARARAALKVLRGVPAVRADRIAAIGYCIGGTIALELGRDGADLAAIVGFHSGLGTTDPTLARNIKAEILVCIGADDPGIPPEQRAAFEAEMRGGSATWTLHLYGGVVHSFTNPDAAALGRPEFARYDAEADRSSWQSMLALFERRLAIPGRADG